MPSFDQNSKQKSQTIIGNNPKLTLIPKKGQNGQKTPIIQTVISSNFPNSQAQNGQNNDNSQNQLQVKQNFLQPNQPNSQPNLNQNSTIDKQNKNIDQNSNPKIEYAQNSFTNNLNLNQNNRQNMSQNGQKPVGKKVKSPIKNSSDFSIGKLISLTLIIASIFFLIAGGWFGYQIIANGKSQNNNFSLVNILPQVGRFFAGGRTTLKGEEIGRTNILLLGLDVEAGLTDSIMLVSYFHKEKKIVTLNIPRDFYVNIPGVVTEKINAIYPLAKAQKPSDPDWGAKVLSNFIAGEFGIEIDYWAVTNFGGVKEVIDTLGGVNVNVDNDFQDFEFPKDDYSGYMRPAPKFVKGVENMNGNRAMIYARSRHGNGSEGSDFARSRRQSIVLQAILEKIKQQGIFGNLTQINNYLNILGNNLQTNMKTDEMLAFADLSREIDLKKNFLRTNWNNSLDFLCDGQNEFGAYVLTYGDDSDCGYVAGTEKGKTSIYRQKARTFVQEILSKAQNEKLFGSQILILGNNSDQSIKVQNTLAKSGFTNVQINNNYNKIAKATLTSKEGITIIASPDFDTQIDNLGFNFTYKLLNQTPENFNLPQNTADIVIWVE